MARKPRPSRRGPTPVTSTYSTPLSSAYPTPLSSAYPSAYPSEDEDYGAGALKPRQYTLSSGLTLTPISAEDDDGNHAHGGEEDVEEQQKGTKGFRFLDLPAELRLRVYTYHFDRSPSEAVDLDPDNHRRIHRKLHLLRTCHQIYHEASTHFYASFPLRVFPTASSRFSKIKKPLLARLTASQRSCLTSLELRLGPGWNKPPRGWVVNDALGLKDCVRVRTVKVFVEFDPSDNFFKGFRKADGFYEEFCRGLLEGVLRGLPSVETVEFDAWKSVKMGGAMMRNLLEVVPERLSLRWGPERGWRDSLEDEPAKPEAHQLQQQQQQQDPLMTAILGFEHLNIVAPPIAV